MGVGVAVGVGSAVGVGVGVGAGVAVGAVVSAGVGVSVSGAGVAPVVVSPSGSALGGASSAKAPTAHRLNARITASARDRMRVIDFKCCPPYRLDLYAGIKERKGLSPPSVLDLYMKKGPPSGGPR